MELRLRESLSLILASGLGLVVLLLCSNVVVLGSESSIWELPSMSAEDYTLRGSQNENDHEDMTLYSRNKRATEWREDKSTTFKFNPNVEVTVPRVNSTFIAFGQMVRGLVDTADKALKRQNFSTNTQTKINIDLSSMGDNDQTLLIQSMRTGEQGWLERQKSIDNMWANKAGEGDPRSSLGQAYARSAPSSESMALANVSVLLEYASVAFLKGYKDPAITRNKRQGFFDSNELLPPTTQNMMERIDVSRFVQEPVSSACNLKEENKPCDPTSPYRTYSGWCNNLQNPAWGKSVTTFDRMIPAVYADGISLPRSNSVTGRPLPSPRYVSQMVHVDVSHLSQRHTLMFMQYGQFLDHDLTFTPVNKGPSNMIMNCRDCNSNREVHPECWPIPVPTGDPYYPNANMENGKPWCLPFTRSLPGQQRLGPREQINQNSAYLDASQVYGEHFCKMTSVRGARGYLNGTSHPTPGGKVMLPQVSGMRECKSPSGFCFHAGDPRSSEQPALAALHTVFLREHNRIADALHLINPHWNDEKVFQQARRILGAQSQHIAYSEFLPKLLGATMIHAYGLTLHNDGYYQSYDPHCKAGAYNEFATAAFRFGHSLIRPNLARMDARYNGMTPNIPLRDGFFNSDMLMKPLMVDEILRGLLAEPMEQMDPFITNEIRNHLFEDKRKSFSGLDLISLNLHRGRDHGLQGYNAYRAACSLRKAHNFQELESEIPTDVINRLQQAYAHVDDIDLFTGALVERPVAGGIVGPTIACIIGNQFKRLRKCDRFWYETNDPLLHFTPQQLAEIRKATLSKLICTNFDIPTEIQKDAFDAPHKILNPRMPCERLPTLNLEPWRESPQFFSAAQITGCHIGGRQIGPGESALSSPCVSCICTPEGTKCASMKITNCQGLLDEASRYDIQRDQVCMAQCGYLLGDLSSGHTSFKVLNIINGRNRLVVKK